MNDELESRLRGWASEYGGGRYENVGWSGHNLLQTLIEHEGFVPSARGFIPIPIRSAADEVEAVVCDMERGNYFRQGRVLRCEYFVPNAPVEAKLQSLRKIGVSLSRATFYDYLAQAKAYVAGALRKASAA